VSRPGALLLRYLDAVLRLSHTDMSALEAFLGVGHMVKPFSGKPGWVGG
jgi:hypothetical protein